MSSTTQGPSWKAEIRYIRNLQFITGQLDAQGMGISRRFQCLVYDNVRKMRCPFSAEGFMFYRPRMIEEAWAALKAERVSPEDFVDIVRSMFCSYHDTLPASKEKFKAVLMGLWKGADPEAKGAFLVAIENGIRDIYEQEHKRVSPNDIDDIEVALASSRASQEMQHDSGAREQRVILYEKNPTSLDLIRSLMNFDNIPEGRPVKRNAYASTESRVADEKVHSASNLHDQNWINTEESEFDEAISNVSEETSPGEYSSPTGHEATAGESAVERPGILEAKGTAEEFKKSSIPSKLLYKSRQDSSSLLSVSSSHETADHTTLPTSRPKQRETSFFDQPDQHVEPAFNPFVRATSEMRIPTRQGSPAVSPQFTFQFPPNTQPEEKGTIQSSPLQPFRFQSPSSNRPRSRSRAPSTPSTSDPSSTQYANIRQPAYPRSTKTTYTPQTLDEIAYSIREVLRKPLDDGNKGTIYILQAPDFFSTFPPASARSETWLKIGISRDVPKRIASLTARCRIHDLSQIYDDGDKAFTPPMPMEYLRRVERLCHTQLNNYRRRMDCRQGNSACGAIHTEWFAVPQDIAKETVRLWVRLMMHNPYTKYGNLDEFWGARVSEPRYLRVRREDGGEANGVKDASVAAWRDWTKSGIQNDYRR